MTLGPSQAIPFRGIRFIGEGRVAEGAFPQGYGLGIRRTTLHQALVERAAEAGVQSLWGTRVRGIDGEKFRWTRAKFNAAGSSAPMGKTLSCASGPVWIEDARRKLVSGSGSISASRRGQTSWKFIGVAIARSLSLR